MRKSDHYDPNEMDDLNRRFDNLFDADDDDNINEYSPFLPDDDDDLIYQNYSNGYGRKVPNYSNNYGAPGGKPVRKPAAYNQNFRPEQDRRPANRSEYRDYGRDPRSAAPAGKKDRTDKPRRGCCGCGCATGFLVLGALMVALMLVLGMLFEMPTADEGLGHRKDDTAAILLCGTDKDGTRTDTMMLIYLDGRENKVGLLSLPRDTLTITDSGKRAKLNSAYGRNGCGEKGMDWTMTYVQRIIGYRPDGYILVDMELVPKIVDLMGGVNVHLDHHIRVHTDGVEVYVPAGDAHLNGEEVLATLRYRAGYANADLGRVQVQRMVITECMKQWVHPAKLALLPDALALIQEESLTDLSVSNFLWIGKTILLGLDNMTSDTLPGYADMRGGASYFILYRDRVAELINASYNPYTVDVDVDDLDIAK